MKFAGNSHCVHQYKTNKRALMTFNGPQKGALAAL